MTEPCTSTRWVDGHFRGSVSRGTEGLLREHLTACARCRDRYERHLLLAKLDPASLEDRVRLGRALGLRRRSPAFAWGIPAGALTLACFAALLILGSRTGAERSEGFASRGPPKPVSVGLIVYRVRPEGGVTQADKGISVRDGLAFGYHNPAAHPFLMVLGLDDAGRVYWYHPSWTDAAQNPKAIPIQPGEALHELPEAITHPLSPGKLKVVALFLNKALSVREVEARVRARGKAGLNTLLAEGTSMETLDLEVNP